MKEVFKIRASASGQIMGARGLGKTGETYVKKWAIQKQFGRVKQINSKYLTKGIENEEESIDIIAEQLGFGMLEKNEEHFENEWFTGTPDIIVPGSLVIDVKNSWDVFTFPWFDKEVPNKDYFHQLQVYMDLLDLDKALLVYVLTDTPEHLIESEARRFCFSNGLDPDNADVYEDFEKTMTFGDIPVEKRVKAFEIKRDEEVIAKLKERVEECRKIVNNLSI